MVVAVVAACGVFDGPDVSSGAGADLLSSGSSNDTALSGAGVARPRSGQGIGDPYYPDDGNLGYNVRKYHVMLGYFPPTQHIVAHTVVKATATARLKRFHLDLVGFKVTKVEVGGVPVTFTRSGAHELIVAPKRAIAAGDRFVTVVAYKGKPGRDPAGAVPSGWFEATTRGAGFIAGEPHSCTFWYPCNDHPTDKARFELTATVPRPLSVVSNGAQLSTTTGTRRDGTDVRTFHWKLAEATATYLTTIYIDKLTFERSTLSDGTPVLSAYGPSPGAAPRREAHLPMIVKVLAKRWGPYPAPQAGGIFVSGDVPFSLETYTRPLYTEGAGVSTIVHENAHQWWGDNVSIRRWRDICFNECLASYSQWLWLEHRGVDLDERYSREVSGGPSWFDVPLYDMGAGNEFEFQGIYLKGTYFVHALRNKIGDTRFFAAMKEIQAERAGGNVSMNGLVDQLEDTTGVDLTRFWRQWVVGTGVPRDGQLYPGDLEPSR